MLISIKALKVSVLQTLGEGCRRLPESACSYLQHRRTAAAVVAAAAARSSHLETGLLRPACRGVQCRSAAAAAR
eukprot:7268180-Alexandrium_andersonii.AAC.1